MTGVIPGLNGGGYFRLMNLPHSLLDTRLADIVVADPRTAHVFDRMGLDYCCQGHRTLRDATLDHHVAISEVIDELRALPPLPARELREALWPDLTDLIQHIVFAHHRYVREHQPIIQGWLEKLEARHGGRHPELHDIRSEFELLSVGLLQHMMKEENILFPFIEALWLSKMSGGPRPSTPFGTMLNPIRAMEEEHQEAGAHLARLRLLTDGYQTPADGCTTYRVCFAELARFEADLHQHVHLENHVLFPRALAIESIT
jgi:regulator of cell morphogenesis and NO signaling